MELGLYVVHETITEKQTRYLGNRKKERKERKRNLRNLRANLEAKTLCPSDLSVRYHIRKKANVEEWLENKRTQGKTEGFYLHSPPAFHALPIYGSTHQKPHLLLFFLWCLLLKRSLPQIEILALWVPVVVNFKKSFKRNSSDFSHSCHLYIACVLSS